MFDTLGWGSMLCIWSGPLGSIAGYLLLQRFSKGLSDEYSSCFNSLLLDFDLYICCFEA